LCSRLRFCPPPYLFPVGPSLCLFLGTPIACFSWNSPPFEQLDYFPFILVSLNPCCVGDQSFLFPSYPLPCCYAPSFSFSHWSGNATGELKVNPNTVSRRVSSCCPSSRRFFFCERHALYPLAPPPILEKIPSELFLFCTLAGCLRHHPFFFFFPFCDGSV